MGPVCQVCTGVLEVGVGGAVCDGPGPGPMAIHLFAPQWIPHRCGDRNSGEEQRLK